METWNLLFNIVLLLGACMVAGGLFARFGQSPMLGYLLAGMFLGGPGSIRVIHSEHEIEAIAELGVALLLFSLGLEFSIARLLSLGNKTLMAGGLQVLLTSIFGTLFCLVFGLPVTEAVAVGSLISLSSTACVLRVLMERSEVDSPQGRNTLAVLLTQDIAVVPLAIMMTFLAHGGTPASIAFDIGKTLLAAGGLIFALHISLNIIAVRALGTLTLDRNRELTLVLAVVVGLGSAWMAIRADISPSLGAFVAGMFLGSSPFATQIRADISSLRTVLLTLFFGAAGMVASPLWIAQHIPLVVFVTTLIVAGKAAIVWGIFRLAGQPHQIAAATGICLAQIGEFAFVLASIGRESGVIQHETHMLVVSVTIASLCATPLLVSNAVRIGCKLSTLIGATALRPGESASFVEQHPDIVIIGFGPAGRLAAEPFVGRGERVHVIDLNQRGVAEAQRLGFIAYVGDASQAEVLEHAHVEGAKVIMITIPDHAAALRILEELRRVAPHTHITVRSRYQRFTHEYFDSGASVVIGDEEEVGARLGRESEAWLMILDETARQTEGESEADGLLSAEAM
ncbi:cation:proton antiporter [Planctomicrobium piriforme]|uniref:Monovalent cation:H+ antiporter-2, CPA2 family n=1 Tax=Planctomicrobium piriforme TaxID=1576369 RepID=A0A1I3L744_9PLAN|nr:cation:proton antiporter [Planctomicrobium piriforme]SFI80346.1 monovalent cation:H+ antiporter-2, CPA2 family [Planctomicrobium piriforme]